MTYKITLLYDEKMERHALDTFEDMQRELDAWHIPYKATNGKVKKVRTEQAEVAFTLYEEGYINEATDIIYTTEKLRKKVKMETPDIVVKFICHTRPFQDLVNMVLEVKQLHDLHNPTIEELPLAVTASESL